MIFTALLIGVITLNTTHDEIPDSTTVGEIVSLTPYNSTNAANWAIAKYNETNLTDRFDAKYTWPDEGIPMTDLKEDLQELIYGKQDKLVSGINVKTINNQSIVGTGNILIQGGGGGANTNDVEGIIRIYDTTNLTPRIEKRIPMPKDTIVPEGLVLMKATTGVVWSVASGSASLGPLAYITDVHKTNYWVRAEVNPEGKVVLAVDQVGTTNTVMMTVEQEKARAMIKENELEEELKSISAIGRFISTWDCMTGRPGTEPKTPELAYKGGDYYLVTSVSTNGAANYIPNGTNYIRGSVSTTVAPDSVNINDIYRHANDGSWVHVSMVGVQTTFAQIAGDPTNNVKLAEALARAANQTNAIQFVIDRNIATNHIVSYATFTNEYEMIINELLRLDKDKRDYYDMAVRQKILDAYLPIKRDGNDVGSVVINKEPTQYYAYSVSGPYAGMMVCKADLNGNLTAIDAGITMGGVVPAIGTKVIQPYDEIALVSKTQTNLVYSAADAGKVLGVTSNGLSWVTSTTGTNSIYREKRDCTYYRTEYLDISGIEAIYPGTNLVQKLVDQNVNEFGDPTNEWFFVVFEPPYTSVDNIIAASYPFTNKTAALAASNATMEVYLTSTYVTCPKLTVPRVVATDAYLLNSEMIGVEEGIAPLDVDRLIGIKYIPKGALNVKVVDTIGSISVYAADPNQIYIQKTDNKMFRINKDAFPYQWVQIGLSNWGSIGGVLTNQMDLVNALKSVSVSATNYTDRATNSVYAIATTNFVPWVKDKNGNRTAVTIGSRQTGTVGIGSFVHGVNCLASGDNSYAEGNSSKAIGILSHVDGLLSTASGNSSYASGYQTEAKAVYSRAEGINAKAEHMSSFVWGGKDTVIYKSKGVGTYGINPVGGLSGFYIGDESAAQITNNIVNLITNKQDKLPTAVNDMFLHANRDTGALEWFAVSSSNSVVSVITNATDGTWIRSDGEANIYTVSDTTAWTPSESISSSGLVKYSDISYFMSWSCSKYERSDPASTWILVGSYAMQGSQALYENATELTFPDGTVTRRAGSRVIRRTALATTNDIAKIATRIILNGTDSTGGDVFFYAPLIAGNLGQVLKWGALDTPAWATPDDYWGGTKVTLNDSDKGGNTASFYAPTSYGENGQILRCTSGTTTPSWVTPTASMINLGNVVNTGDSATPVSGGTTKFTTGGAYTELAKKVTVDSALKTSWAKSSVWTRRGGAGVTMIYGRVQFNAANSPTGSADDVFRVTVDGTDVNLGTMTATCLGTQDIYVCHVTGGSGTAAYGDWVKLVRSNGATFTGKVNFSPTSGGGNGIDCANNDGLFNISAGTDSPKIYMRGGAKSGSPGVIDIIAQNTSASKTLILNPNGTFTWGGKNVAVATDCTSGSWTAIGSTIHYTKYNGVVYVQFYNYKTTGTSEYSAGTLPAGYRPAINMPCVLRCLGSTTPLLVIVATDGGINIEPGGVATGTTFFGTISFPSVSN